MLLCESSMSKTVDVAAGILLRPDGEFLLASRPPGKVYAGYWEFPGGKLESGESAFQALVRELYEELGIKVEEASPWIVQTFCYPHATVRLHFFRVTRWQGELHPHEGQSFAWQRMGALSVSPILPANGPILRGLVQPDCLAFSNVGELGETVFLQRLQLRQQSGPVRLVLREPQLTAEAYQQLAVRVRSVLQHGCLLLHRDENLAREIGADGVHFPARCLLELKSRPQGLDWVGASVHNTTELRAASQLGLDYAVLGHVAVTPSHPNELPLGWEGFASLLEPGWPLPVYAIGGMHYQHVKQAQLLGAQGVAMLRAFWELD